MLAWYEQQKERPEKKSEKKLNNPGEKLQYVWYQYKEKLNKRKWNGGKKVRISEKKWKRKRRGTYVWLR